MAWHRGAEFGTVTRVGEWPKDWWRDLREVGYYSETVSILHDHRIWVELMAEGNGSCP